MRLLPVVLGRDTKTGFPCPNPRQSPKVRDACDVEGRSLSPLVGETALFVP
jgi:hypothetical protein